MTSSEITPGEVHIRTIEAGAKALYDFDWSDEESGPPPEWPGPDHYTKAMYEQMASVVLTAALQAVAD